MSHLPPQAVALVPRVLLFACACEASWCGSLISNLTSRSIWRNVLEDSIYLATTLQHSSCLQQLLSRTQACDEFLPAVAAVARKAQVHAAITPLRLSDCSHNRPGDPEYSAVRVTGIMHRCISCRHTDLPRRRDLTCRWCRCRSAMHTGRYHLHIPDEEP